MDKKPTLKLKSLACALLAAVMVFSFAGCKDRGEPSESSSSESSSMVEEPSQDPGDPSEPEKETLDKIAAAQAQNSDVVGWLTIPNTTIDAEVLQKVGDNVYYERRDITQKYNWYGCYYADGGNTFGTRNDLTKNTIIYGHNMEDKANGLKFAQLMHYLDVDWASKNPYIYFSTPEDDMVFQVYAVFYTDTGFQYHLENPDTATFDNIIKEARLRSELNYDVDVNTGDKILTLSTCTYKFGGPSNTNQRFVVQARLLRAGEEIKDTVNVTKNPNHKAPNFN